MYFINQEHQENFNKLMDLYNLSSGQDIQYEASIYIAAVPEVYECFKGLGTIDTGFSPLFELMKWNDEEEQHVISAPGLTGSTRRMVELGLSLYNGREISLDDVFGTVASNHLVDACLEAIKIRARKYW